MPDGRRWHDDGRTLADFLPRPAIPVEVSARSGSPLPAGSQPAERGAVVAALREIYDPEIPVNVYDLGLIYGIELGESGSARVAMTLTAPTCSVAGEIPGQVAEAIAAVEGVGEVEVRLVWDPPWSREKMSDEARLALDLF